MVKTKSKDQSFETTALVSPDPPHLTFGELNRRVDRIHNALGKVREQDLSQIPVKTVTEAGVAKSWGQDFRGDSTDADLENDVHTLIHNIANLPNHLRK